MPLSPKASALSGLYRNRLFQSDARVEAHDHVACELTDHALRWKQGIPNAAMFKGQSNHLKVYALRYGAEVEVTPRPFDSFALVHTSLSGGAEIESDGQRLSVGEGRTAVLAPTKRIRLRWYPGTEQLIVKVPHTLIREVSGRTEDDKLALAPGFLLPRGHGSQWDLIVQSLLNVISISRESTVHTAWLDHFERNAALFLLSHQPDGPAPVGAMLRPDTELGPADTGMHAGDAMRMDAVLRYMLSRLCAPISLDDLARAGGVGIRTLNALCHRYHGVTPMELLRDMRLDAVRSRLMLQPHASITSTALAFGFGHLGRFSGYYRTRFGELPRDTLTKQRA
jgi:AraC-like DNA-binding protein